MLGPRSIMVLVDLLTGQKSARSITENLGYDMRSPEHAMSACSSVNQCLRKMEERGFVEAAQQVQKLKVRVGRNKVRVIERSVLVWSLTPRGEQEANILAPAVKILKKSTIGLGIIRGTALAA
jgi:hypothetical protein